MPGEQILSYASDIVNSARGADSNPGLLWDRYFRIWTGTPRSPERADTRLALKAFMGEYKQYIGKTTTTALLQSRHQRLDRALASWKDARTRSVHTVSYKVTWRMATGLGADHPTENGFTFDYITGLPYLPGSSVKGMCRAAAIALGRPQQETDRLFGPGNLSPEVPAYQGELVIFDALPKNPPKLALDIINCHHSDYYGGASKYPAETESPIPVFFLTVAQNTEFVFRFASRSENDLSVAADLMDQGLSLLGIGAKTAVGYGVMQRV